MDFFEKECQAVILVGGLGTRLKPLTKMIPKPMVDINGKPFLEYKLNQLKKFDIKKIIFCIGYLGDKIKNYFGNGDNFGLEIKYAYEEKLLGTAGAIKNAEPLIETDPFIVMNGDTYFLLDINSFLNFHKTNRSPLTMAVTIAKNPKQRELIELKNNKIKSFLKRDTLEHTQHVAKNPNPLINAGVYVFNKEILNLIPHSKRVSLEEKVFPELIEKMMAFEADSYFRDIGNMQQYEEFKKDIFAGVIK